MALTRKRPSPNAPGKAEEPGLGASVGAGSDAPKNGITPDRAAADMSRQRVQATRHHRITGAKLSVDRKRPTPAYQAILMTSRNAGDAATGYRMALGVTGAMGNKVLDNLGLLAEEGKGGAKAEGSLDRQQVAIKREEERLPALERGLNEVRDASRKLGPKSDINALGTFQAQVAASLAPAGLVTPGSAIMERGVIEAAVASARDFSTTPDENRLLKARFFAVQQDALKVESRGEALTPPQIFGFSWKENGQVKVAGITLQEGQLGGHRDASVVSATKEPELILDAQVVRTVDPMGGPQSYERVVIDKKGMSEFFSERGISLQAFGGKITGESLKALEEKGFRPVTSAVHTGDFLPREVQERRIPGELLCSAVQAQTPEIDRLLDIVEMARERSKTAVAAALETPAMKAKLQAVAEGIAGGNKDRLAESLSTISKQQFELHESRMDLALGASQAQALKAMGEYLTVRNSFHRSVVADPFQVELGRSVSQLLKEAGLAKRDGFGGKAEPQLYQRIDQVLNRAHEKWGNADHIRPVSSPLDRHPLVMAEAMKEIRRVLGYYAREKRVPGWSTTDDAFGKALAKPVLIPGLSDEKVGEVLGDNAQRELVAEFNRSVKGIHLKGKEMNIAIGGVMADGLTEAMLADGAATEPNVTLLRSRFRAKIGVMVDRYQDFVKEVRFGGEVIIEPAQPKPPQVAAIDDAIDAFMAVDGDGRWVNETLRRITEEPSAIFRELEMASVEFAEATTARSVTPAATARVTRAARMARARECFKMTDSLMGALEDLHLRPQDALRLPKALGAITRDGRVDDLKATMPYAASTPVVEEGRIYVAPVKDNGQGEAYLVFDLDREMSGDYVSAGPREIAPSQLAKLIEDANTRDIRLDVLRHGVARETTLKELLPRFGVFPISEDRYLVNVQANDNGRVGNALGLDMRGTFWPEARLDRTKNGFSTQVAEHGGLVVSQDGVSEAAGGKRLEGPHVYLRVREENQRNATLVYFPVPTTQAGLGESQKLFANYLDQRAGARQMNGATAELYNRFKVMATTHFNGICQAALDGTKNGYAALSPKFQAGVFEPDLFSMVFFEVQERRGNGRANATEDKNAIQALEGLVHLRSRLGCQVDLHAVRA